MAELSIVTPSSFVVEFNSLGQLAVKSCKIPQKKPKVAGGDTPISSGPKGKFVRQVVNAGFEGLFTFDIVCICSASPSSASVILRQWFQKCLPASDSRNGGKWADSKDDGAVYAHNIDGEVVAQWEFRQAFPNKYSLAELNVESKDYLLETCTIICEYWEQVPV